MANVYHTFQAASGNVGATQIPELVAVPAATITTNATRFGYAFDGAGTTIERIFFEFVAVNYASGNLTVTLDWYARSGTTTGNVKWEAAIMCLTPGDAQSMETDTFATATNTTTTVNGTARGPNRSTITVSNLDSLAQDDHVTLCIDRDPANDTMTTDALLLLVTVSYLSV